MQLRFSDVELYYIQYAASIKKTTPQNLLNRLIRRHRDKHVSLQIATIIDDYEKANLLPSSYATDAREAWNNMVANSARFYPRFKATAGGRP